jgi:hypothetical protein
MRSAEAVFEAHEGDTGAYIEEQVRDAAGVVPLFDVESAEFAIYGENGQLVWQNAAVIHDAASGVLRYHFGPGDLSRGVYRGYFVLHLSNGDQLTAPTRKGRRIRVYSPAGI